MFKRWYGEILAEKMNSPYVHILFGAGQTGKSTLLSQILPVDTVFIDLSNPVEYKRYLTNAGDFVELCEAMIPRDANKPIFVCVDEVQNVPDIFNAVQYLYDRDKKRWRFILCGSSARKLRTSSANLLPGRSILHHLFPLISIEHRSRSKVPFLTESILPMQWKEQTNNLFDEWDLESRMVWGSLPGIVTAEESVRSDLLKSYAIVYLEEEIRRETKLKDWSAFLRFLRLAAIESNKVMNFASISRETGISQPTVRSYYELLIDMFAGVYIPAFTKSLRKNLLSTSKFLFFDLGVRNASADIPLNRSAVRVNPGYFFEHWAALELWKRSQYLNNVKLHYFRTRDGVEIDFIIEKDDEYIPVEIKWTDKPNVYDCRNLIKFLNDHSEKAYKGYIVCRCPRPLKLHEKITALPWNCI